MRRVAARVAARLAAAAALVALLLCAAAGTWRWERGWALVAVMLAVRLAGARAAYRAHPALLRERAGLPLHAGPPRADRVLVLAVLATGFLGLPAAVALDAFRWHLLPPPAPCGRSAGLTPSGPRGTVVCHRAPTPRSRDATHQATAADP